MAWQSGVTTEIEVPRPHRRDLFRTPPAALERMRALAAAGRHDEEIAQILNAEGMRTGRALTWNTCAVRWTRKKERIGRGASYFQTVTLMDATPWRERPSASA